MKLKNIIKIHKMLVYKPTVRRYTICRAMRFAPPLGLAPRGHSSPPGLIEALWIVTHGHVDWDKSEGYEATAAIE
jgi:hypothetical protein